MIFNSSDCIRRRGDLPFAERRAGGELWRHLDAGEEADVAGVAVGIACSVDEE